MLFGSKEEGNAVVGPKDLVDNWDDPLMVVKDREGNILGHKTTRLDLNATLVEVDGETIPVRQDKAAKKTAQTEVERKRDELVAWMAKTTETSLGSGAYFIEILQK